MVAAHERSIVSYLKIIFVVLRYLTKFVLLIAIFPISFYLMSQAYLYFCKGAAKILSFFMILLKPPKFKLLGLKITDFFSIADGIISFIIGIIYLLFGLMFTLSLVFVSIFVHMIMTNIY